MRTALALLAVALASAAPAAPATPALQAAVEAKLAEIGPGTRWGLVVTDSEGREIVSIAPEDRFIPASNTKMFTVAAALATLPDTDKPDGVGGTSVYLDAHRDIVLVGSGDARLSSAPDCIDNCLATLAAAVAAKTRRVGAIIGDATAFADRRWSWGMSWNNVAERSGTGVAALSLDSNQIKLQVTPAVVGQRPYTVTGSYLTIDNRATTVATGETTLDVERLPFERTVRLTGQIALGAKAETIWLGIDDPAHYVAWALGEQLKTRGVRVTKPVRSVYRAADPIAPGNSAEPLARTVPPPLREDMVLIDKVSQNLHAELLIRRVGAARGEPSVDGGLKALYAMLERAGVPRSGYDFADGSGMSTYNRVAPRAMTVFLRWTQTQPWGAFFRSTLPIGGVDGTLAKRFAGTPLAGKLYAKTGTLNATNALSGWMTAASGRELTFSFFANDVPAGRRATPTMDAVLNIIAAMN